MSRVGKYPCRSWIAIANEDGVDEIDARGDDDALLLRKLVVGDSSRPERDRIRWIVLMNGHN